MPPRITTSLINELLISDDLMFGVDPGTVKNGEPHEVMKYLRAWRPTFIYVSIALLLQNFDVNGT